MVRTTIQVLVLLIGLATMSSQKYEEIETVKTISVKKFAPELKQFNPDSIVVIPDGIPVEGEITSGFGMRHHPLLNISRLHAGIDFTAPFGADVVSTAPGIVIKAEDNPQNSTYGKHVIVDHGIYTTTYAHLSKVTVEEGDIIDGKLGELGSTGLSTGPHLHYEIRKNDQLIDPYTIIKHD